MNSSDDTIAITCLHPSTIYQFGSPQSYYYINLPILLVNLVLLIFIVLGNTTVIVAYFRNKSLQSIPNMLLITLAFTDLFVGLVAQPLFMAILVRDVVGARPLCWLSLLSSVTLKFCGGASLMILSLVISLERYMAICHPFKHRRWVTKTKIKRLVFMIWSFLLALSGSLLLGIDNSTYLLIITFLTFIALAVTGFACCAILSKMKTRRKKNTSVEDIQGRLRSHSSVSAACANEVEKPDYKIAVTMFYIVGALLVCYTPMFAAIIYAQINSMNKLYLKYFYPNAMTFVMLNSLLNPIIYCLRNRKFTNAIRKISGATAADSVSNCYTIAEQI